MPPLEYISSYVEALVSLLVFGISIPTILMNVQPRLRHIREQYGDEIDLGPLRLKLKSRLFSVGVVVLVVICSIALILLYQIPTPSFFCNLNSSTPQSLGCRIRNLYVSYAPYWVNLLLLVNIIFTAFFIRVLRSYGRDHIIQSLGKICCQQAEEKGRIDEDVLLNLGELGEICAAGREKQGALATMEGLLTLELAPKSWADMAEAVTRTITEGNERNIAQAMKLLQSIFRRSYLSTIGEKNMKPFHNHDILKKLESIFIQAFGTESPMVHSQMMTGYDELADQAPNDAAKAFLRIGRIALERDLFQHAVYALGKLDTLIRENLAEEDGACPQHAQDAFHNYFALLAYFWNHGINTRKQALTYLEQLSKVYGWDDEHLNQLISEAGQAMKNTSLREADMLEQMLYSNRQMASVRKALKGVKDLNERHEERILMRFPSLAEIRKTDVSELMACGVPKSQAEAILWQAEMF